MNLTTNEYCRTCLSTSSEMNVIDKHTTQIIAECTSIQVTENDIHSHSICGACQKFLLEFYDFRTTCIVNQQYLDCNVKREYQSDLKPEVTVPEVNFYATENPHDECTESTATCAMSSENSISSKPQKNKNNRKVEKFKRKVKNEKVKKLKSPKIEDNECVCPVCHKRFTKSRYMLLHARVCKLFKCEIAVGCARVFHKLGDLQVHINEEHTDVKPKINCSECIKAFYLQAELDMHFRNHHEGGECSVCGVHVQQLRKHLRQAHHEDKPYSCEICHQKFRHKHNLGTHRKKHSNNTRTICNFCGMAFARIKEHVQAKHTNKHKRKCHYCNQLFDSLSDVRAHAKIEHDKDKKPQEHQCQQCDKKYTHLRSLWKHVKFDHEEHAPIECAICGHRSKMPEYLKRHMLTHTNERPFSCAKCPRKFRDRGGLRLHDLTHTGVRPHACDVCDRAFTQRSALTTHKLAHKWKKIMSGV